MKARGQTIAKMVAVILMGILLTNSVSAMNFLQNEFTETSNSTIPEMMIKNLEAGLKSDNVGLKRSCIFCAGFYEIRELVGSLREQLTDDHNTYTRVLIALALYKIGGNDAMRTIQELASNDSDPTVKNIGKVLLNQFEITAANTMDINVIGK